MGDAPIIEPGFVSGVVVVDIGDLRVARGLSRRPFSGCHHTKLRYDGNERRIWCSDCETTVEAFDAFEILVKHFHAATARLAAREKKIAEAEQFTLRSLAAKVIDEAWRRRNRVPACPHCRQGLFPEDFKDGIKVSLDRDYAEARRARK